MVTRSAQGGHSRRGFLLAGALWILASTVGGAVGGLASEPFRIDGYLILPGLALGAAQALILWRYFKEAVGPWVAASFAGWIAGWLGFSLVRSLAALAVEAEIAQWVGSVYIDTGAFVPLVVWVVFAASQGVALAIVALAFGRRRILPLAALWPLAGTLGGILAVTASYYLSSTTGLQSDEVFSLDASITRVAGQAAGGALYGATTGVVLAVVVRRSAAQEDSAQHRSVAALFASWPEEEPIQLRAALWGLLEGE